MKFMLLYYDDPAAAPPEGSPEEAADFEAWMALGGEMAPITVEGSALQPVTTATTVRMRDGGMLLSDGPFAETKEQLGGYDVIEVPDLETAVSWAEKAPNARTGAIEIRQILEF